MGAKDDWSDPVSSYDQSLMSAATPPASPSFFSFPNPVNDVAARVIASGVVLIGLIAIVFAPWLSAVLAVGFLGRVAAGPKASLLGLLATRVIVPRLGVPPRPVAGPPKRFAQAIGLAFSLTAAVLSIGFGLGTAAAIVLGGLVLAAGLEAAFGLCLGCKAFAVLIRAGIVPPEVCEACNDIWAPRNTRAASPGVGT